MDMNNKFKIANVCNNLLALIVLWEKFSNYTMKREHLMLKKMLKLKIN
jgi:hypothetical protein